MLQRFFFTVQFFLRAVLASAVGHNPLIRHGHGNSVLDGVIRYQHAVLDVA